MEKKVSFLSANIVTAFSEKAVGTKVVDKARFMALLPQAIEAHDFGKDKVPGQGVVQLPPEALATVAGAGVGKKTKNPDDYVLRTYRGSVGAFLKREKAAPAEAMSAVVYTAEAYLLDPEVLQDTKEADRIRASECTHVLVSVLASAGPEPQLSFERFVKNLAGANNEFDPAQGATLEKAICKAKLVGAYGTTWATVAD